MKGYKFQIVSRGAKHWSRIVAGNGEIVLSSETYTTRFAAEKSVDAVIEAVANILSESLQDKIEHMHEQQDNNQ